MQELEDCAWTKEEKYSRAPNVMAFTRRFNFVRALHLLTRTCNSHYAMLVRSLTHTHTHTLSLSHTHMRVCASLQCTGFFFFFAALQTSFWVIQELLCADGQQDRLKRLVHFIKVAKVRRLFSVYACVRVCVRVCVCVCTFTIMLLSPFSF